MPRKLLPLLTLTCLAITGLQRALADFEHPIAVRQWSNSAFTIETMHNMHVGIGLNDADVKLSLIHI